jgi:hypothetical protein
MRLIEAHGLAVVQEAERQFELRERGILTLERPWMMFLQESPGLLKDAKEFIRQQSPEVQAAVAANVDRMAKIGIEFWKSGGPQQNEMEFPDDLSDLNE